jgi:hypothetical protein
MISRLQTIVPQRLVVHLAPTYHAIRQRMAPQHQALDRRFLSVWEFEGLLLQLGIKEGGVVLVHSL